MRVVSIGLLDVYGSAFDGTRLLTLRRLGGSGYLAPARDQLDGPRKPPAVLGGKV